MSKNIVDAVLSLNRTDIGLLPSRRQIDYDGGYVGWTTEEFCKYVGSNVLIERDHAGAQQGSVADDGRLSYLIDAKNLPLIHVDPWKSVRSKEDGLKKTIEDIKFIYDINTNTKFEIGTEESIFPLSSKDLEWLVGNLEANLEAKVFEQIEFVVIQSGVKLDVVNERNTGNFNIEKLERELEICAKFSKKSKEHNGDFLSNEERRVRFDKGLSAINIGPEISVFENSLHLKSLSAEQLQKFGAICYENNSWRKWISEKETNLETIFKVSAHYNYQKLQLPDINVVESIRNKLMSIIDYE
jgi:hypothetical protein